MGNLCSSGHLYYSNPCIICDKRIDPVECIDDVACLKYIKCENNHLYHLHCKNSNELCDICYTNVKQKIIYIED